MLVLGPSALIWDCKDGLLESYAYCRYVPGVREICIDRVSNLIRIPAWSLRLGALDSPVEEDGFEPSVPRERDVVDGIETPLSQPLSARRSAARPFSRGFCCSKLAQPLLGFLGREEGVGVWRQLIQYSPRDCEVAAGVALDRNGARRSEHSLPANRRPGLKGT